MFDLIGTLRGWSGGKWIPEVALIARQAADELLRLQIECNGLRAEVETLRAQLAKKKVKK